MQNDFITRLEVANYGCLHDVKLDLTRLHAFIGPNDSGKSTILRAVRSMARIMSAAVSDVWPPQKAPFEMGLEQRRSPRLMAEYGDAQFELSTPNQATYQIALTLDGVSGTATGSTL